MADTYAVYLYTPERDEWGSLLINADGHLNLAESHIHHNLTWDVADHIMVKWASNGGIVEWEME